MNNGPQTLRRNYGCFQQEAQMNSTATSTPTMIIDPAVQELMAGLPSTTTTVTVSEPPQTPGSSQQPTTQAAVAGGHLILPPPFVQVGYAWCASCPVCQSMEPQLSNCFWPTGHNGPTKYHFSQESMKAESESRFSPFTSIWWQILEHLAYLIKLSHEKSSTATVSWRHPNELVEEVDDDPDDPSETPPSSADQRGCQVAPATTPAVGAKTLDMGFVYTLDTPTSALVKCGEDSLTYLNLHQM